MRVYLYKSAKVAEDHADARVIVVRVSQILYTNETT